MHKRGFKYGIYYILNQNSKRSKEEEFHSYIPHGSLDNCHLNN